ncbi:MAG: hypothetical protein R2857_06645 [Vampirovibrionales bacterium]
MEPPPGIELNVEANTKLSVSGADKELVGQVAANIRGYRKPEPTRARASSTKANTSAARPVKPVNNL